jgi:subtilase family serine protease
MSRRLAALDRLDRDAATVSARNLNVIGPGASAPTLKDSSWRTILLGDGPAGRRTRALVLAAILFAATFHVLQPLAIRSTECRSGNQTVACPYTPAEVRAAYDVQPLLGSGVDGRGRTILLYELSPAPDSPTTDIYQDLAAYDRLFGLPPVSLAVVPRFAPSAVAGHADREEVLDVEVAHAIAPAARIQVLLADPENQLRALRFALVNQLADVISTSWSFGEGCVSSAYVAEWHVVTELAASHGVTMVASAGDFGAVNAPCLAVTTTGAAVAGVSLPASDPLVTAVGGTRLAIARGSGRYIGEVAWNSPPRPPRATPSAQPSDQLAKTTDPFRGAPHSSASGGGFSRLFPRPDYQTGLAGPSMGRGVPDVAADADPSTGVATVVVVNDRTVLLSAGGTSASAPLWAGVAALADQEAGRPLGPLNPALYRIARGPQRLRAFHDITVGNNTVVFPPKTVSGYSAAPGWDPVTGLGSPDAAVLVPLLVQGG